MSKSNVRIDPIADQRFELVRPLGEGAFGAVFLVRDRSSGELVALKKFFNLDPKSVARFKREFRSLADLHHQNLVKLYYLDRGQDAWFMTMEYVSGKDLRAHFGAESAAHEHHSAMLLRIFHELASGVHAIHRAGLLHRDLKPSNVMISDEGRVVVLDFGLVREIDGATSVTQEGVAGTPAYMPPEQALGEKLGEASDWYAFGVMLYEAISGVRPIDGANATVLIHNKLTQEPARLSRGAPQEVLELCMDLLERVPERRPSGDRILETLAAVSSKPRELITVTEQLLTIAPVANTHVLTPLFGRQEQLEQLHLASGDSARSHSLVMHVKGASGSGKSALIEHFLSETESSNITAPVILRSRCYEREAMPFKALDGIVDALVSHLLQLDEVSCANLLPAGIVHLARLFPVFERLGAVQRLAATRRAEGDETQIRRRGEQALRKLVTSLGAQKRLLLWIDDMQWGDLDSAGVLRDWLEQPLTAPVLILLSYRSDEVQNSSSLAVLLANPEQTDSSAQQTIELAPLRASEVRDLCLARLAQHSTAAGAMVERIVAESDGNPFLALQLTAIAEAKIAQHDTSLDGLSMDALIAHANAFMAESARALLNVLAVAGRPLRAELALGVAGVFKSGRAHIHTLRGLRLLRSHSVAGERTLEVYHDRVRETVSAALQPEESKRIHAELLRALQLQSSPDHDWLHTLALGAGDRPQAFRHGLLAAEHASAALAFERASELYIKCIELVDDQAVLYSLWLKLAAAQSRCRRGYEAAKAYLSAAELAPLDQRGSLLQLAASHLVRSGRFEEGERIVQRVLDDHHMHVPTTTVGLLAAIVWEHSRIALRSLNVPTRDPLTIPKRVEEQALLYGVFSIETQLYAPLRAGLFQARALRLALDYGTPSQVARALCLAAAIACVSGTQRAARRSQTLLHHAEQLFKRDNDPEVQLELLSSRAVCAQFLGNIKEALPPALAVDELVAARNSDSLHGDYYYMFTVNVARISALQFMGRLLEARQALHEHVARARATDNRVAILQVAINQSTDEQAVDLCASSRARLDAEYEELPKGVAGVLTAVHVVAVMRAACVTRDYDWAFSRMAQVWESYRRSLVHRCAGIALLAHATRARLLLNHYVETRQGGDPETVIQDDVAQLRRLPSSPLRDVALARLRARLACIRGDRAQALQLLESALKSYEATELMHEIWQDRYWLGLLLGNHEGMQLVAAARGDMIQSGIADPDATMRAYIPELTR